MRNKTVHLPIPTRKKKQFEQSDYGFELNQETEQIFAIDALINEFIPAASNRKAGTENHCLRLPRHFTSKKLQANILRVQLY
jgi:hypothetical protein